MIWLGDCVNNTHYFAVDSASIGFAHIRIITDSSGEAEDMEFLYTNPAFNCLFGENTGFFTNKKVKELTQDKEKIDKIKESATALMDGVELNFDLYYEKTRKWMRIQLTPQGALNCYVWVSDITAEHILMQNSTEIVLSKEITPETIVERFSKATASSFSAFYRFKNEKEGKPKVCFSELKDHDQRIFEPLKTILQSFSFHLNLKCVRKGPLLFESFKDCLEDQNHLQELKDVRKHFKTHSLYFLPISSPDAMEGLFVFLQDNRNSKVNLKMAKIYAEQIGMVLYTEKQIQREKAIEEELRKNNEICQLITENTTDGVALLRNNVFEYVSPSYKKILGYSQSELTGMSVEKFLKMIHPDDRNRIRSVIENITKEKKNFETYSYRIRKKDGDYIWLDDRLNNKFDETGKHIATYVNSRDITHQVYYEETLQDSEELFREVFNNAHDAIFIHKIDEKGMPGKFIMANREALQRLGYSLRELKQMTPSDIDHKQRKMNTPDIMKTLLQKGEHIFSGEEITKSGKIIPVEIKAHLFTLQGKRVNVSISRDITEELEAQEREHHDKAFLQSILDTLPGKLLVINQDYHIIAANKELLLNKHLGNKTPEALRDHRCYELFHSKDHPCEGCRLKNLENLNETETKIVYRDEDGKKDRQASKLFLAPLKDENGEKFGIIEYSMDITELKNAQRKAEKASKAKTEFMMNMSHELRTPLNGIIGFSGILLESGLNESQKNFVRNIQVSGKTLLNIVSDILNYSQIEAKRISLDIKKINLYQLLSNTFESISEMADNKGLQSELYTDLALPSVVLADPLKLSQILSNLLMNAVKFTEEGTITCKAEVLNKENNHVDIEFSVSDTGIGIAEEIEEEIFESFTQADSSLTRKYGGTGLGLTISNSLLKMMGSSIDIQSELGKGSTFSFTLTFDLPNEEKDQKGEKSILANALIDHRPCKILIVEDNFINLKLNQMVIRSHFPEATIFTAEDGKIAVEEFIKHRPDIILMDIRMPGINGFEATETIRKIEGDTWQTKIIALSADARTENIQIGMLSGLDGYITKPVDPEELIKKIEGIIRK
jgi:PAS domain S-box-containing protein